MNRVLRKQLKRDTPRGIVLCIDLLIVLFTYLVSNLFLTNFFGNFDMELIMNKLPMVFIFYPISFYLFKPYRGIIRQTSLKDVENVFLTCLFASFLLTICSSLQRNGFINDRYSDYFRYSYSFIFLHLLFTTVMMVLARLFYSQFYHSYILDIRNHRRVLIYGAGDSGIITVRALQSDTKIKTEIVGFLDDSKKKIGTRISGYQVYAPETIDEAFILKNKIDDIIISIQNVPRLRLNEISEILEQLPVSIKIIPPATDWLDGNYTNRQIKELKIEDLLGRKSIELDNPIIAEEIHKKVIFITGAAGSIGSEIARQIARFNFKTLVLVDHAESPLYDVQQTMKSDNCENIHYVVANIRDEHTMDLLFARFNPDMVYHAAAYKHVPLMEALPYEAIHTNIKGTKVIADLSVKYHVNKFVMVSTDKAVNPTNVMGATKRAAEIYVSTLANNGHTNFIVTRFGNVLGSNGSVIPLFKRQIDQGGPLTVTHEDITRYFMTIPEACQLVLEASVMGHGGEIFVFDMGQSMKIIDLAKRMIRLSGLSYPNDIDIKITGLRPGEKIYEELLANDENTVKTHHEKIMIAKVRNQDLALAKDAIENLCKVVVSSSESVDAFTLVGKLKAIVPEFQSQNSRYESLDKKASVS
ncbi:polysaccharide biosynthesis protein [Myroides pelagicus]|uniref:SDR family NAD(P)-dependent oxidoreductase n=1 Tax=Myroides pelagicus TaxID=270914 RepID=A0A7K1GQE4_9FLAO|nr:nucleoside-diphosphate sugar epimerase/dehydratase [Myroides pelagicus]MEC4114672.1 nucleoside-diphosphate sugar epimerase/dehydratase [Myroides pelagicus]MTH31076.1 SDR family NAD(P)-dependent oxidoreductase [Myroides pelagicus]